MMKLENKANMFIAKAGKAVALQAADGFIIQENFTTIRFVQSAQNVQ